MKISRITSVLFLLAVVAAGAAGCSLGRDTAAGSGNVAEGRSAADRTKEGRVKITVSVWDNANSPQFQAMADSFMEKNPEIDVELLDIQSDEYNNKLTVLLAGNESDPDVIMIKDADTQISMREKGQILDLTSYIARDGVNLSIYNGAADQLQMDGKQYTLPFRQDWYVLFYNKNLFDMAGEAYPADDMTWDEYERLAERMTLVRDGGVVYGTHHHTWMALVSNWAVQDGNHTLMNENYAFLKPYYEQALRMQEEGVMQSYANLKISNIHYTSVFEQQQCAMVPMGTWFIATLVQDRKAGNFDFNWGVTRIPHPAGIPAGSTVGSVTPIAINAKSDVPDQAWEFVRFATSEAGAEVLADNSVFPAITTPGVVSRLASIEGFPEDGKAALSVKNFVFDRPVDAKMAAVRKVIEEEHDAIMIGEEDIDTGIANMNERAEEARSR